MSDPKAKLPEAADISATLRDTVIAIYRSGKTEDLTLKNVRTRSEQKLGLETGFFKQNTLWNRRSKSIVKDIVDSCCNDMSSPERSPRREIVESKHQLERQDDMVQGPKRKAVSPVDRARKHTRPASESETESETESSDAESTLSEQAARQEIAKVVDDPSKNKAPDPLSIPITDGDLVLETARGRTIDVSGSELSEPIDQPPERKRKPKTGGSVMAKQRKIRARQKAESAKSKLPDEVEQVEIKRLQAWLLKCGIRKICYRDPDYAACSTSKERIDLLKSWLKEAGMDGKYSNEKAAAIKEKREFAKDLAAIQEGDIAWGSSADPTSTGRPSRRAATKPSSVQQTVLSDDSEMDKEIQDEEEEDDDSEHDDGDENDEEDDE